MSDLIGMVKPRRVLFGPDGQVIETLRAMSRKYFVCEICDMMMSSSRFCGNCAISSGWY